MLYQCVPADFIFPKMSLMTLITSWFCGNKSMKLVPLKLLRATEIKNTKERYKLSQMKTLMLAVEIAVKRVGTWGALAQRVTWDVGSTVRLYESVQNFFRYPSKIKCRTAQISWQTVYNLFKEHNKVFATDLDCYWRQRWDGLFLMACRGMNGVSGAWGRTQWMVVGGSSFLTNYS